MADVNGLRKSKRLARHLDVRSVVALSALDSSKPDTLFVPPEVKGLVADCLQKSDLRSLRYVSKQ